MYNPAWYTPEWLTTQEEYAIHSERALLAVLALLGIPKAMLDLGCGNGTTVQLATRLGICAVGIDIALSKNIKPPLFYGDLTKVLILSERFDLILCWEVGEHLMEDVSDVLCSTIKYNLVQGGHLVFTAATPNQDGYHHINCQPSEYWREKLEQKDLTYDSELTEALRQTWQWCVGPMIWLPQNLQVFVR